MKIAYYCQHVLGIGHFHRSLEICKSLSHEYETTMITGGPEVEPDSVTIFQLPGLEMDHDFKNLRPCDPNSTLTEVKEQRKTLLYTFFTEYKPDIFVVELYPFGRKAFRFELDPVLRDICNGKLPTHYSLCSLRDILVERHDQEKFEKRVVGTLNRYFDGLLIHSDKHITALDYTFSHLNDITIPIHYTGYVTPRSNAEVEGNLRRKLEIAPDQKLIVASIGGGNVGEELLFTTIEAYNRINNNNIILNVFLGHYTNTEVITRLKRMESDTITITPFSSTFPEWLEAADLSVSMAGYNTCMNILAAGTPSLLYPFGQNQEQRKRVMDLMKVHPQLTLISELSPQSLKTLIEKKLFEKRFITAIDLDGADNTRKIISNILK